MRGPVVSQRRKIPDANAKLYRQEYEAGATLQQIVDKHGHDRSTISRAIVRVGGEMRPQSHAQKTALPRELWPTIRKEYEAGADLRELGEKYKVHFYTIRYTVLRAGGTMRKGGGAGKLRKTRKYVCAHCQHKKTQGLISWLAA